MTDEMTKVCEKCFWFKQRTNGAYSCSSEKYPVIADGYNPCIYRAITIPILTMN